MLIMLVEEAHLLEVVAVEQSHWRMILFAACTFSQMFSCQPMYMPGDTTGQTDWQGKVSLLADACGSSASSTGLSVHCCPFASATEM